MSDPPDQHWQTYAEAAETLGISTDAVRKQARRGAWPKQRPNAPGQPARVLVPQAALSAPRPPPRPPPGPPLDASPGQDPAVPRSEPDSAEVAALRAHVDDLRLQLHAAAERELFLRDQVTRAQAAADRRARRWWRFRM